MSRLPADPGGLFPLPAPAPAKRKTAVPDWERVQHSTLRCDVCVRNLAEARGQGLRPQPARWRHHTPDGAVLLCYRHAIEQRDNPGGT